MTSHDPKLFLEVVQSNDTQETEESTTAVSSRGPSVTGNPSMRNKTTGKPGKYKISIF